MLNWDGPQSAAPRPAERLERELRYRAAAPLVATAALWCDLSHAPAAPEDVAPAGRALEVDPQADLTRDEDLALIRAGLLAEDGERVVTCFDTIERLGTFVPLVRLLTGLAEHDEATVVLSVPNDDVLPVDGDRGSVWGPGAFEELRRLLPAGAVLARQAALVGSVVLTGAGDAGRTLALSLDADDDAGAVATTTHLLAAFGPRADGLSVAAAAGTADVAAERAVTRRREARLEQAEAAVRTLTAEVEQLRAQARTSA